MTPQDYDLVWHEARARDLQHIDVRVVRNPTHTINNGDTVLLDKTYRLGSPLDLPFLKHIDVVITGEIHLNDSYVYYWADHTFKYDFQNMSAFWKWGGEDVNIYGDPTNGKSLIDGHGQLFWEEGFKNKTIRRPMLFAWDGMKGATMSHLRMRNPPMVSL